MTPLQALLTDLMTEQDIKRVAEYAAVYTAKDRSSLKYRELDRQSRSERIGLGPDEKPYGINGALSYDSMDEGEITSLTIINNDLSLTETTQVDVKSSYQITVEHPTIPASVEDGMVGQRFNDAIGGLEMLAPLLSRIVISRVIQVEIPSPTGNHGNMITFYGDYASEKAMA